jgi:nucleoside-diphosphate-sugar epimerase
LSKTEALKKAYGEEKFSQIEFRQADLLNKEALSKAVEGVQYIIHLANPLPGT